MSRLVSVPRRARSSAKRASKSVLRKGRVEEASLGNGGRGAVEMLLKIVMGMISGRLSSEDGLR